MNNFNSLAELKKLSSRDLTSNEKTKIIAAFQRFVQILSNPQLRQNSQGKNPVIFQCLSQIFLTDNHRHFSDEQLRNLLDIAAKSRLLSISENHLLDRWSRNIEERDFEPFDEEEAEDEGQWIDEETESEEEEEEEEAPVTLKTPTKTVKFPIEKHRSEEPIKKSPRTSNAGPCFKCGQEGHIKIDCPTKSNDFQRIFNDVSILINSNQNDGERKSFFDKFCRSIEQNRNRLDEKVKKIFIEKEAIFYSLVCHVAQRQHFFSNVEFSRLFELRQTILPTRYKELNANREKFTRQRPLKSFESIDKEIRTRSEIHPTIFNDFEEILIRTKPPISVELFDLIKYFCQSSIHVDSRCFEYWTKKILFGSKKSLFNENQLDELRSSLENRTKRSNRNEKKTIWKERLNEMKSSPSNVDVDQWISDLSEILVSDETEKPAEQSSSVDHGIWYFSVLSMTSCFSLTKNQYETLLKNALQSFLFNKIQKEFFQIYLDEGQPPISMKKLNEFKENFQRTTFDEIKKVFLRKKPETSIENVIPFIDNHVRSEIISLVQKICADQEKFPPDETKLFLDEFLSPKSFIRPLTPAEEQRLKSFESNFLSIDDFEPIRHSIGPNWTKLIDLFKQRSLANANHELLNCLTEIVVEVFSSPKEFSLEQCDQLKSLIRRANFDRTRYELINSVYDEYRKKTIQINATILNEFSTKILRKDLQAHREFFELLNFLPSKPEEMTIEFELIRCFVSGTVLIICQSDYSTSTDFNGIPNELKMIVERHSKFYSTFFTTQQFSLIKKHLNELSRSISTFINAIRTNINEENLRNLCDYIQNELKEKREFDEVVQLILWTFDEKSLSMVQTSKLAEALHEKVDANDKSLKSLLQFLLQLLNIDHHQSPKNLLEHIDDRIEEKFIKILKCPLSSHAPIEWKEKSIELVQILFQRKKIDENLEKILRNSPMFQSNPFKDQLASIWNCSTTTEDQHPNVHREFFRCLESSDSSLNAVVSLQIHQSLVDEKLLSNVFLNKFIQMIEIILKNPQKFAQFSSDEWAKLIAKNRRKIFTSDSQCDNLLLIIFLERWNLPKNFLFTFDRLVQSRNGKDRQDLFSRLTFVLKQTKMKTNDEKLFHLPTIANELFHIVRQVIFNQKFSDDQVRNCIESAKNSWLFTDEQRQILSKTM